MNIDLKQPGPPPCAVGDVIDGRYRIDAVSGSGGMGTVFRATHLLLARTMALKVVSMKVLPMPGVAGRFLREARLATQLQSEHLVQVFDVGVLDSGAPYLVMEWLDGQDLAQLLERSGPLPVKTAVDYALQVCEALAEVHGHGIVHRDLKPANLFLVTGRDGCPQVKLLDFGVSKIDVPSVAGISRITRTGAILGSPSYMSPEQMGEAESSDARTDVWGLGVVLFELLTDSLPFGTGGIAETFSAILLNPPPKAAALEPSIPSGLDVVLARCLQAKPEDRYQDVASLARALAPFGSADAAMRAGRVADADRTARRSPVAPEVTTGEETLSQAVASKSSGPPIDVTLLSHATAPRNRGCLRVPFAAVSFALAVVSVVLFAEIARMPLAAALSFEKIAVPAAVAPELL